MKNAESKIVWTKEGAESFLSSAFVPGIGKVYAKRLVEANGPEIIERLASDPGDIKDISGIGESRMKIASEAIKSMEPELGLMSILFSAGVPELFVQRIRGKYRKKASEIIQKDPYRMVEEVWRLSFFTADKIGKFLGIPIYDSRRICGAILTSIKHFAENGHVCAPRKDLIKYASIISKVPEAEILPEIEVLKKDERINELNGSLYLPVYFDAEWHGAKVISDLMSGGRQDKIDLQIPEMDITGHRYTNLQREAIEAALTNPVMILTGGPGSGKTTVLKGIIDILDREKKKVILVAPTGRAAKRMTALTGKDAFTIHRLLGYRQGEGYRKRKIDTDVLIIDEASMLEQVLFNHLLQSIKSNTRLILVGDVNQLPAIGAGNVLMDMIVSGKIPTICLTENFRQMNGSKIAECAALLNEGKIPEFNDSDDLMFVDAKGIKGIREKVVELVTEILPEKKRIQSKDILVVTPQQIGELGVKHFNEILQTKINPYGKEITRGKTIMRLGDPVMQTSNSSVRGVYNGELGTIIQIDEETKSLTVEFSDGRKSIYKGTEIGELVLAYAISVHKLQGSEVNYMVMPLTLHHKPMLYRNLIYTAVSRAKDLCVFVGEREALELAVNNDEASRRNSNFKERLRELIS